MNELPVTPVLTDEQEIEYHWLDPGYIRAEQISGMIFFAVVLIGAIVALVVKFVAGGVDLIWYLMAGGSVLLSGFLFWVAIFWPRIAWRRIRWRLDEQGLEIRRGVIWRHRISVPFARVQHADVSQGPVQRMYDIGTLTVHTAGTSHSSVELAGLNHGVAMGLRDRLVRQRGGHDHASA